MKKGLLLVFTGNGKGKTTAALGQAFRALGHGFSVCFIQFIKGSWKYGELTSSERFKDFLQLHVLGRGFTWMSENLEEDKEAARRAWEFAKEAVASDKFKLVVLDELTHLIKSDMVDEDEIVGFLGSQSSATHIVVTGRDAPKSLIDLADLVTEMKEIKHYFKSGISAQKGIEF